TRGVNTFVLTLLSWTIPAIFIFNGAIAFSGEAYALAVTIFYLTVFPSIYFIHSQPIVVAPVILRLLLAGEFFQAMDLFLSYPRQYVHLLKSGPIMGMTSLKVALTKKIEVFVRTARSNDDPVQMTANLIESLVEKISAVLTVSVLGLTLLYLPSMIAAPVIGVLSVYYLTSVIYTQWVRKYMVRSEKQTPDSGARLTSEVQGDSSDLSGLIINFGKYFDFGQVFGPERQKAEALKKKGLEELFRNINPQLNKPLLRQFLDTAAPDRSLKDIQKIEFISKLGEGDFRSSYLIEITVAGQVYRLTAKISAGPELKYRKHQAVSAIARKSHGVSKAFQGVWEMQDGYTVLLRDYYGGSSVKDVYEDAREKKLKLAEDSAERAAIDEKITRMMDHLNESVIELWADTHGMATDFHSANFLADTDNDLAVRIVDYGLIPTKSTEISRIEFTESGQPVFYNDSDEEIEKSFMSVGYSDMRSKFVSAFHEPYPIYLEDENGYEYETVHSIPYDQQKFSESVVRYFSERGDFGVLSDETILETADKVAGFAALVAQFRPDLLNTSNTGRIADSSVVDSDKLADENAWADSKLIDYLRKSIQESDDDNFRGLVLIDRNSAPDSEVIYYVPITKNGNPNRFDRSVTEFQSRLIQKQALQEPRMFPSVGVVLSKPDSIKTFLWTNFILFDHALDQAGKTSGSLSGRFRVIARDRSEEERITQEI
ncbi:MAG: hypothetical protein KC649_05425, partial [Candidatus Omnitrophica bacterium]|nr:hypothetical protein [Candidatus Omnitrophota bacterium]